MKKMKLGSHSSLVAHSGTAFERKIYFLIYLLYNVILAEKLYFDFKKNQFIGQLYLET